MNIDYEDLASSKFKGRICTRSGKHPYNVGLVASMIAHDGEVKTKKWLQGVKIIWLDVLREMIVHK